MTGIHPQTGRDLIYRMSEIAAGDILCAGAVCVARLYRFNIRILDKLMLAILHRF
jgi:hypothetical protein